MNNIKYILPTLLLFSGCMVGPKYNKPEMSMPSEFEEKKERDEVETDLCYWWKQFNDPVLDDLIQKALEANYDLRIAIEKIQQARAQYRIERSHLWPEIDLNAVATRSRLSKNLFPKPETSLPQAQSGLFPSLFNIFQIGFDAIWEIDVWGKFRHGKKAAYYTWESMQDEAESVLISMVSEVAVNYVAVRALQKKIDLTKKRIEADEEELKITQDLYQIGLDNEIQLTTLISTIESDRAALPVLEASLKQTAYTLAYLLGRQPEGFMEVFAEERPIPSSTDKVPVGLPSELLRRRPDIRSAERQLAAATEQIGAAVADLFPHIALTGITLSAANQAGSSVGLESYKLDKLFTAPSRVFSVGLGINWDILDFGRVRSTIDVNKSLQKQALLTYEQTVISSLKDVESALVAYFEEQKRRDSLVLKVSADRRTFEITGQLYEAGLANETQVLEAKKTYLASETTLVESDQSLAGDLIAIYKAIGGNWDPPID